MYLFINLFHATNVKESQKCKKTKVEQRIKKIFRYEPHREGASREREWKQIHKEYVGFYVGY